MVNLNAAEVLSTQPEQLRGATMYRQEGTFIIAEEINVYKRGKTLGPQETFYLLAENPKWLTNLYQGQQQVTQILNCMGPVMERTHLVAEIKAETPSK